MRPIYALILATDAVLLLLLLVVLLAGCRGRHRPRLRDRAIYCTGGTHPVTSRGEVIGCQR